MMGDVQRLLETELLQLRLAARRLVKRGVLYMLASVIGLAGTISILAACLMLLLRTFGPEVGAIVFGGLLLSLSLLVALVARRSGGRQEWTMRARATAVPFEDQRTALNGARAGTGGAIPRTPGWLRDDPLAILALAMMAGIMAARRQHHGAKASAPEA